MENIIFKVYNGEDIVSNRPAVFQQMQEICNSNDIINESLLEYLDEDNNVIAMFSNGDMVAFSWLTECLETQQAELNWFVTHKTKIKGLEAKKLLDKTINYCKSKNIKELCFNCAEKSWGNIKDKLALFNRFGYTTKPNELWDMSIGLSENHELKI